MKIDIESAAQAAFEAWLVLNARGRCPKDSYEPGTFKCDPSLSDVKEEAKAQKPKSVESKTVASPKTDIYKMKSPDEFKTHLNKQREETFARPEVLEAISQTEGAKITSEGLELTVVRYQEPEMAGAMALRGAVFYLPEKKSPYAKYYTGHKNRYGGTERFEGKTIYRNPMIIKGATGGTVPERAYVQIKGKQSLKDMQDDVSKVAYNAWYDDIEAEHDHINRVKDVLEKYGGDPGYANEIHSGAQEGGNLKKYAIQEHIIAATVRDAGYDGLIGYTKMKGKMHLSEVLDVRTNENPFQDEWEDNYESYYDDFYEDKIKGAKQT